MEKRTILIVDDEKAIVSLLEQVFARAGYKVLSAASGEKALKILENESVPVMFFDLNLPEMNGIELCRAVKKNMPMSIIFAVTGYASVFELAECLDAGFEDYFKKPVNISSLVDGAKAAFEKVERWKRM